MKNKKYGKKFKITREVMCCIFGQHIIQNMGLLNSFVAPVVKQIILVNLGPLMEFEDKPIECLASFNEKNDMYTFRLASLHKYGGFSEVPEGGEYPDGNFYWPAIDQR